MRPTLFGYIKTREEFQFYVNELFSLLQSDQLKPRIHKIYDLKDAAQAQTVSCNIFVSSFSSVPSILDRRLIACQPLVFDNLLLLINYP